MTSSNPISFPFRDPLALAIANLITSDIEALEKELFNFVTGWQSKYQRPYKAHYANDISERVEKSGRGVQALDALPKYQVKARDYTENPNKRGRPLSTFVMGPDRDNREYTHAQDTDAERFNEKAIKRVDYTSGKASEAIKVEQKSSAPQKTETKPMLETSESATDATVEETLATLAALLKQPKNAKLDETRVLELALEAIGGSVPAMIKNAMNGHAAPTRIEVKLPNVETIKDMGVQHQSFPTLLQTVPLFPVWLPGPAGSGKTTAARNVALALEVPFHHHGAVDNVYQLLGFIDAGGTYHGTSFRAAYEHGGVFLWDEVDASNPAALVAFNAAIENGECVFPDKMIVKHPTCYFIAAANTYGMGATHEYVGRTKLDAATLDRFVMLDWAYDENLERAIAGNTPWTAYVQAVRKACRDKGIKHLVTPRAAIRGNALLAQGLNAEQVIAMTVRKGLSEDQWNGIKQTATYRG